MLCFQRGFISKIKIPWCWTAHHRLSQLLPGGVFSRTIVDPSQPATMITRLWKWLWQLNGSCWHENEINGISISSAVHRWRRKSFVIIIGNGISLLHHSRIDNVDKCRLQLYKFDDKFTIVKYYNMIIKLYVQLWIVYIPLVSFFFLHNTHDVHCVYIYKQWDCTWWNIRIISIYAYSERTYIKLMFTQHIFIIWRL